MAKVTIIVPFYNVELYIEECLFSLVNQTYRNIEILCIDDCSPDNSLAIVQDFAIKDGRIKIIRHEVNKGLGGARNTGIEHATGNYICFVDSDDYVADTFVAMLYKAITNDGSDMVICGFFIDEVGVMKKSHKAYGNVVIHVNANNVIEISKNYRSASWLKMYKRDLILENTLLQPEKKYYEDVVFWLMSVFYSNQISVISERLYYYRRRSGSIMTTISYMHINDRFEFVERIYDFVKNEILTKPDVDIQKISFDLLSYVLVHLRYGKTLVDDSNVDDAQNMKNYYYNKVVGFSSDRNWLKLLDAYNNSLKDMA